jgi:hypothetical protein
MRQSLIREYFPPESLPSRHSRSSRPTLQEQSIQRRYFRQTTIPQAMDRMTDTPDIYNTILLGLAFKVRLEDFRLSE